MSGFRGTIGSPEKDSVIAFIYDRIERLDVKSRNRIFRIIQSMQQERASIAAIPDLKFRKKVAKLLRNDAILRVQYLTETLIMDVPPNPYEESSKKIGNLMDIEDRLRNLVKRHYRVD